MSERIKYGWVNGRINDVMNEWVIRLMNEWVNEWIKVWMNKNDI